MLEGGCDCCRDWAVVDVCITCEWLISSSQASIFAALSLFQSLQIMEPLFSSNTYTYNPGIIITPSICVHVCMISNLCVAYWLHCLHSGTMPTTGLFPIDHWCRQGGSTDNKTYKSSMWIFNVIGNWVHVIKLGNTPMFKHWFVSRCKLISDGSISEISESMFSLSKLSGTAASAVYLSVDGYVNWDHLIN